MSTNLLDLNEDVLKKIGEVVKDHIKKQKNAPPSLMEYVKKEIVRIQKANPRVSYMTAFQVAAAQYSANGYDQDYKDWKKNEDK